MKLEIDLSFKETSSQNIYISQHYELPVKCVYQVLEQWKKNTTHTCICNLCVWGREREKKRESAEGKLCPQSSLPFSCFPTSIFDKQYPNKFINTLSLWYDAGCQFLTADDIISIVMRGNFFPNNAKKTEVCYDTQL